MAAPPPDPTLVTNALYLYRAKDANLGAAWNYGTGDARLLATNGEGELLVAPGPEALLLQGVRDLFGRTRTSIPYTVFSSKQVTDADPLMFENVSGASFSTARSSTTLTAAASGVNEALRRSFQWVSYITGGVNLAQFGTLMRLPGSATTGVTKEVGLFNSDDGYIWGEADGVMQVTVRSSAGGGPVNTTVQQSNWNIDVMDGTGRSGITLNPETVNTYVIMYSYTGAGDVIFALNINGQFVPVHMFRLSNVDQLPYTSNPSVPATWRIATDGTGAGNAQLEAFTVAVQSFGNGLLPAVRRSNNIDRILTPLMTAASTAQYVPMAIRYQSAAKDPSVRIVPHTVSVSVLSGGVPAAWQLVLNPTVSTGSYSFSNLSDSVLQAHRTGNAPTVTGGTPLFGGTVLSDTAEHVQIPEQTVLLGVNNAGTADILALVVQNSSAAVNEYLVTLSWYEFQ